LGGGLGGLLSGVALIDKCHFDVVPRSLLHVSTVV
jgi:hypothetical protein